MSAGDFVIATVFEKEEEARAAASLLLEHGVGAQLTRVVRDDGDDQEDSAADGPPLPEGELKRGYAVEVLGVDLPRALEVLGIEARVVPVGTEDRPAVLVKGPTPWKSILAIWLVAMIAIPLLAFWLTYTLLSR